MPRGGLYRSSARLPVSGSNDVRPVASEANVNRWILDRAGECYTPELGSQAK